MEFFENIEKANIAAAPAPAPAPAPSPAPADPYASYNQYFASNRTDTGTGTELDPWNVTQARNNAVGGDRVYFRGGIYNVNNTGTLQSIRHGTSQDALIVFQNYPNEKPRFTNGGTGAQYPISLNHSNIVIDGFEVYDVINMGRGGITVDGAILTTGLIRIHNCYIHDCQGDDNSSGIQINKCATTIDVYNNKIHNVGGNIYSGINNFGICIFGCLSTDTTCYNQPFIVTLRNNEIYNLTGHTYDISMAIRYKHDHPLQGIFEVKYNKLHDVLGQRAILEAVLDGSNIHHNLLYKGTGATNQGITFTGDYAGQNCIVEHNTIVNIGSPIKNTWGSSTGHTIKDNILQTSGVNGSEDGASFWFDASSDTGHTIDNNFHDTSNSTYTQRKDGYTGPWRDLAAMRTAESWDLNGNSGNALFTDSANSDYTLQAGSPCKTQASDGLDQGCYDGTGTVGLESDRWI